MLLLFALYSFEINVVAAIFNLVIGILFIFIGNKNEDYLSLFYDGIILLILDVIVQFSEYWLKIPFYVYIFLLGILLVGYATYRELNKNKAKVVKKVEDKKIVYLEKKEYNVQYNILGVVTIISLAILFSLYSSLEYNSKVTYEINHFYENLDKYIKERNLDSNKYLFVYSNHYAGVYIEENNTLDPYDFMDYFDIDMVEFYWCSKDSMEYNFKVHKNNKRYDRWYDDYWYDKSAIFSKSDDKVSKLFYLNSYSVEIKSDINDFNFYRTGGKYSEELNLEYNQYETNRLDVCVNSYSDVYVYSIGQVFNYLSKPDKKCYYVTGNNSVNFRVIAFNNSINNNYNQYDNQGDYEY